MSAPKVYFRDTGLLHRLLDIPDLHSLWGHPRVGASWEGFALEQILLMAHSSQSYYWATHGGAELDLIIMQKGRRYGFEVKFSESPKVTLSMREAVERLKLDHLWIVYPGLHSYPVGPKITVWPLMDIPDLAIP